MVIKEIQSELARLADRQHAAGLQRFFKTGPGEYGEGDRFRGIRVPVLRKLAKKYRQLPVAAAADLLRSPFHEDRLLALFLLIDHYYRGGDDTRAALHRLYLAHTGYINNWDLVDASAPHLVGHFLKDRSKDLLTRLAGSALLWERRIAVLATFAFIKEGSFDESLRMARLLMSDSEDLIHKAVGWMLREVGKREFAVLEDFVRAHHQKMPRTMLRYAIEKFPESQRRAYVKGAYARGASGGSK